MVTGITSYYDSYILYNWVFLSRLRAAPAVGLCLLIVLITLPGFLEQRQISSLHIVLKNVLILWLLLPRYD